METGYQRGLIQDESLYYEMKKHDGSLPIVGVNTFLNPQEEEPLTPELARSSTDEKESQINRLQDFQQRNSEEGEKVIAKLKDVARANGNMFEVLMEAVKYCSLGQISDALFEVGGQYRRNM